jgi:dTDP-4-dehydrorhamnose 3,5-epimerase
VTPHNFELVATELGAVKVLRGLVLGDGRGHFYESWRRDAFRALGLDLEFVQDNQSVSKLHVLRGLHWQAGKHPQGKLVRCVFGKVWDVVVDIRMGSPTFGKSCDIMLEAASPGEGGGGGATARNPTMVWVPPGFAHGFLSLAEGSVVEYKCTAPWSKVDEGCLRWNDPELAIKWPVRNPTVSERDAAGMTLADYRKNPAFGGKA